MLLSPTTPGFTFSVASGLFAVEADLPGCRARVMDFLLAGDVVHTQSLAAFSTLRLRAIEAGRIARIGREEWIASSSPADIQRHAEKLAARTYLAHAAMSLPEVDSRLATFLVAMTLRQRRARMTGDGMDITIPRDDMADYIQINPDTLSRAVSRMREQEIITRLQRHRIVVLDWAKLRSLSPLSPVIEAVFA